MAKAKKTRAAAASPVVLEGTSAHLIAGAARAAVEQASSGATVQVEIRNIPGRPFSVVNLPGGKVAWGVGGSGAAFRGGDIVLPARNK